jgi:hypothetical protein
MARWRVDYIGKGGKHLGSVEAADEKSAIAEAMETFHITRPAVQDHGDEDRSGTEVIPLSWRHVLMVLVLAAIIAWLLAAMGV